MTRQNNQAAPVYIADIHPEPEGGYSVTFPDLPGCITQGDDFADAVHQAADAANLWLDVRGSYPQASDPVATTKAIVQAGGIPAAIAPAAIAANPPMRAAE